MCASATWKLKSTLMCILKHQHVHYLTSSHATSTSGSKGWIAGGCWSIWPLLRKIMISLCLRSNNYCNKINRPVKLDFQGDNVISDYVNFQGAEKIADALKDNRSITTLDLVKRAPLYLLPV